MTHPLSLRVMVQDVWDEISFELPTSTSLADMKRRALKATQCSGDPNGYVLKFRGARYATNRGRSPKPASWLTER